MSNIFQKAVDNIFQCSDFLEKCTIDGQVYDCIASVLTGENAYTVAGLAEEAAFTLILKLPLPKPIRNDGKVTFRGKQYRVASQEVDSAPASVKIHLRDTSQQ